MTPTLFYPKRGHMNKKDTFQGRLARLFGVWRPQGSDDMSDMITTGKVQEVFRHTALLDPTSEEGIIRIAFEENLPFTEVFVRWKEGPVLLEKGKKGFAPAFVAFRNDTITAFAVFIRNEIEFRVHSTAGVPLFLPAEERHLPLNDKNTLDAMGQVFSVLLSGFERKP